MEERIGASAGSTLGMAAGEKCKAVAGDSSGSIEERTRGALNPDIFSGSIVPEAGGYSLRKLTVLLRYSRVSSSKQRLAPMHQNSQL